MFDEEEGGLGLLQGGGLDDNDNGDSGLDQDFLSYELEYLSLYGFRPSIENDQDVDNDMNGRGGEGGDGREGGKGTAQAGGEGHKKQQRKHPGNFFFSGRRFF